MKRQRTIPLRETLDNTIFEEMKELYPTVSNRGVEYKQTCSFLGIPCDFDFMKLSDDIDEYNENSETKITVLDTFSLFTYCLLKMSKENGYYFNCHKRTIKEISFDLNISDVSLSCSVFDFLVGYKYLYNFDNKITSTISIRNYECIQSSRMTDREYKTKEINKKTEKKTEKSDDKKEDSNPFFDMEDFDEEF